MRLSRKTTLWLALAAVMVVGAACGGGETVAPADELVVAPDAAALVQPEQAPAALPTPLPTPEAGAAQPVEPAAEPAADAAPQDAPPPAPANAQPLPGRPSAPAPIDSDFRADPASVVAATGRPQFIEFFAYW